MKRVLSMLLLVILGIAGGCSKEMLNMDQRYTFAKPYCAKVVVGGFVGIAEKCYAPGDSVVGRRVPDNKIRIRIAEHSAINEGPPSNMTYQEELDVPAEFLEKREK